MHVLKKRSILIGTTLLASVLVAGSAGAGQWIQLVVDGKPLALGDQVQMQNGTVTAPVRAVAESLGANVTWDGGQQAVLLTSPQAQQNAELTALREQVQQLHRTFAAESARQAVDTYARGVQTRNGALQYAVLAPTLQKAMYAEFATSQWVTGTSSPWVREYKLLSEQDMGNNTREVHVQWEYATSSGFAGLGLTKLRVQEQDEKWVIMSIANDVKPPATATHSLKLPNGTVLRDGDAPTEYQNLQLSMRTNSVDATGDLLQQVVDFYPLGRILQQEQVNLPSGVATLGLVEYRGIEGDHIQRYWWLSSFRNYPNRPDKQLAFSLRAQFTGDSATAKQQLLTTAQSWNLQD